MKEVIVGPNIVSVNLTASEVNRKTRSMEIYAEVYSQRSPIDNISEDVKMFSELLKHEIEEYSHRNKLKLSAYVAAYGTPNPLDKKYSLQTEDVITEDVSKNLDEIINTNT